MGLRFHFGIAKEKDCMSENFKETGVEEIEKEIEKEIEENVDENRIKEIELKQQVYQKEVDEKFNRIFKCLGM